MKRRITIEIPHIPHQAVDPEDWMRAQGWKTMTQARQTDYDFQFVGGRSETVGSNVFGKDFHKFVFFDHKKARAFLLVWNGKRV